MAWTYNRIGNKVWVLEKATRTAFRNFSGSRMSCWIVGKVDAPPKAKRIVPNAREKLKKVTSVWRGEEGEGEGWRMQEAVIKTEAKATVTRAKKAMKLQ